MFKAIEPFILTFIPIFVAVDAIGNIPIFLSLVEDTSKKERKRIVVDSVATATLVALIFMFLGKWILRVIGITIPDFQIAGGILLFVISIRLLLPGSVKFVPVGSVKSKEIGVFPLGTPLVTGPAVLTTTLIMLDVHGLTPTFVSLVLNMLLVWVSFAKADAIMALIGPSGTRALSKIMYILLAAIGVMMVRRGIMTLLGLLA